MKDCNIIEYLNDKNIAPFIDELVDMFYKPEINMFINKKCETNDDKRSFLMFILMYFYTYLNNNEKTNMKTPLKIFLTDLIRDSDKRKKCIEMYISFENNIKNNLIQNDVVDNVKKIKND